MNRPERKDYIKNVILENNEYIKEFDIVKYCNDCDDYIYQLEKALDKACEELESLDYRIQMMQHPNAYYCDCQQANQWKEWVLQDE